MSRPWKKLWPRIGTTGKKSYIVGYYDHDGVERTKTRGSASHAREWMGDYFAAEGRGPDSLRRFLLDLDAKEANGSKVAEPRGGAGAVPRVDAHPRNEGGLAPSTYERYEWTIGRLCWTSRDAQHKDEYVAPPRYAVAVATLPVARFNSRRRRANGVMTCCLRVCPSRTRDQERGSVLSAALSWAASSYLVPEIQTNGCGLANDRASTGGARCEAGGTGYAPAATPSRAGGSELGALTTGSGGDPRPDAPAGQSSARNPQGNETRWSWACSTGSARETRRSGGFAGHRWPASSRG